MLNQVYLFTGENTYALHQQLENRKSEFVKKFGSDALFQFKSDQRDLANIKQALYAGGLFVSKKMVIVYGVPRDTHESNALPADKIEAFFEDFVKNQQFLDENTILICVSYKPDKRTKAYKRFSEHCQVKDFAPFKEIQLKAFLKEQLAPLQITDQELSYFLLKIGNDLRRLANECEKLKIWLQSAGKTAVSVADIDLFCFGMVESDSFAIFDQLFADPVAAVKTLEKMQEDGKMRIEVNGLLTRGLKIFLTILDFAQRGITSGKEIIAATKLHPFVVNKNLKHLPALQEHQAFLVRFFGFLLELELAIKTGKKPDYLYWFVVKEQILSLKS